MKKYLLRYGEMKTVSCKKGMLWRLLLLGAGAGFVNGFLGAGGGIIVVLGISRLLSGELTQKNDVFATALCVMLPISLLSCFMYALGGSFGTEGFGVFVLPAMAGGVVGGLLLGRLKSTFMRRAFSALIIVSGIILIVR